MKDKFTPGTVVYLKTTEEPFFILSVLEQEGGVFSGVEVTGRRPLVTDQGIKHVTETFLAEELQTAEEKKQTAFARMSNIAEEFFPDRKPAAN